MEDFTQAIDTISSLGYSALFLWLLLKEMRSHDETRARYYSDLRDIAGLSQTLSRRAEKGQGEA